VRGMDLPAATRRLLARPLHAAGGALRDGRDAAAVRALERFRDDVVQPLADGALSEQREAFLHAAAGRILAVLQAPTESDLGTLGGATSRATAVNGRGMVVGDSTTADGETHGFIWRDGVMTDLGTLGGASSTAAAVNASGEVAGESRTADGDLHAFLWRDGEMVDLGPAGGTSHAVAINSAGVVVGTAQTGEQNQSRAVRWCQMRLQFLDVSRAGAAVDVNDRGVVAAWTSSAAGARAALWHAGRLTELGTLGGDYSFASGRPALNRRGDVIGYSQTGHGVAHAFLWSDDTMTDLGTLGGSSSSPTAVNDDGDVVGYAATAGGTYHAFLWDGTEMQDLGALGGHNLATGVDSIALAVNDHRLAAGSSVAPGGVTHAVAWRRGDLVDLGPGAAADLNARGLIAGTTITGSGDRHAAVWRLGPR